MRRVGYDFHMVRVVYLCDSLNIPQNSWINLSSANLTLSTLSLFYTHVEDPYCYTFLSVIRHYWTMYLAGFL